MIHKPAPKATDKGEASRKFVKAMKQILSVPKEELAKRESAYQQERTTKKASRKSKLSALVVFALVLVSLGCATQPVSVAQRRQVAPDRIANSAMLAPSPERTAKMIITRDSGYTGSGAGIDVFVDGQRLARLAQKESITVYVAPGRHLVGARFSWGPVSPAEREFTADAQRPCRIRVTTEPNATSIDLKPESGLL